MFNCSLEAKIQPHLGHERHGQTRGNLCNGKICKVVQDAMGDLQFETPRDCDGALGLYPVPMRQVRLAGMEEIVVTLGTKGLTTRDIESALVNLCGVAISRALAVTDAVLEEAHRWQPRLLEAIYPIVWQDGIVAKVQ